MSFWELLKAYLFEENNPYSIICLSVIIITFFICKTVLVIYLIKMISKIVQHIAALKTAKRYKDKNKEKKGD